MKKIFLTVLALIGLLVVIVPRFYHLGTQPPGLHIDEVSFAADAKAIAETGRDTWNEPWPLVFKAFGEWKAPGLVYSMAFWSKLLGTMDNTVARLPSAIAGLSILATLFLTLRVILPKSALASTIIAVLVLAYSPWHYDMSRIFYESFSALAFITLSIWYISRATLSPKQSVKLWVYGAVFAGLSGYWYASIRYVVIIGILLAVAIQNWSIKVKLKTGIILLLVVLGVGIGWVGDLVSDKGLNRLYYYQTKSAEGATLEIDEKRQYCYLAFDRDPRRTKICYLIWNKPVLKVVNAAKTYYTYLGTDFLFLKANSEFGFDSEYGAYLLPLLPIYLVGLYVVLSGTIRYLTSLLMQKVESSGLDRLYTIYIAFGLLSLLPAAVANNVNMRMGLISLYIIAIIIGIGTHHTHIWIRANLPKLTWLVYFVYTFILGFFVFQSMMHYHFVFTLSNDLMWTSDSSSVFGYIKSVSGDYDQIVDSELHGPLAPYFYGDLSTVDVQNGSHSEPDIFGFTYLTKAGKYELRHVNIIDLACEKLSKNNHGKTLVVTSPVPQLSEISKFAGRSLSGALLLREVYDVDDIINHQLKVNASFKTNCMPKL